MKFTKGLNMENRIITGDALKLDVPDKSVNLIITHPPYVGTEVLRYGGEADKQINNLYQQLKSGKDFALMAKQYSVDAASAVKGGDLGWVTADELVPAFATAMNELPLNTISKPVKSPFGWHIIEVLERKSVDDSKSFQRQQVRQFLQQRKFSEAVTNWQQHLRTDAYVNVMEKELA